MTRRNRSILGPLLAVAAAAAILVAAIGPVAAGNTRVVEFGSGAPGTMVVTTVSAGSATTVELTATNTGRQTLTKAVMAIGSLAADGTIGLPAGVTVIDAELDGVDCAIAPEGAGAACQVGNFVRRASVTGVFTLQTTTVLTAEPIGASFKVAENVQDQGANTNTFYASGTITADAPTSNGATFLRLTGQALRLSTADDDFTAIAGDTHTTTLEVPGATGGFISIIESDGPTGCTPKCIGQEVEANVRDGDELAPYLEWTLVIKTTDVQPSKGGVIHILDDANAAPVIITNTKKNECSARKTTDCIVSFVVDKVAGTTTIVFRTETNGRVKGFG